MKLKNVLDNATFVKKSTTPGEPDMLDPDMALICSWCHKDFKPYNHMVNHDYAYMDYCCDRHFVLDIKYGKLKNALRAIPRWLIWKPYFYIQDWHYKLDCPDCHKRMTHLCNGWLYFCEECGSYAKVSRKKGIVKLGFEEFKKLVREEAR